MQRPQETRVRFAVLLALVVAGCASLTGGGPFEGTVTDENGKPIPGAFVVARTVGGGADMVGSRSSCRALDVQQADAQGRFRVSAGLISPAEVRVVTAYAPGYGPDWVSDRATIRLGKFKGTGDERVDSYTQWQALLTCGDIAEIAPKLRPLYEAVDEEYRNLRRSREFGSGLSGRLREMQ